MFETLLPQMVPTLGEISSFWALQTNRVRLSLPFVIFASALFALSACNSERGPDAGTETQAETPNPADTTNATISENSPKEQTDAEEEEVVPTAEPETPPAPDRQETEPKSLAELAREIRPAVLLLETVSRKGDRSMGTGFFVSEEGEFVTNWHVVEDAAEVVASEINEDGSRGAEHTEIEILRKNVPGDLALLKAATKPKKFLNLGQAKNAEVGEPVVVFGNPRGLSGTLSEGIISARRVLEGGYSWVQITAPISPGSSGSPLLSLEGDVWGVVSWQRKDGQNLNFSSPVEAVADLLEGTLVEEVESGRLSPLWSLENEKVVEEEWVTFMEEEPSDLAVMEKARFLHRKYPESIHAREILTGSYMVLEMYREAREEISELLEIDPENFVALLFLAKCGEYKEDWELVEYAASRGVKSDPSSFKLWAYLFYALMNLENYREAVPAGRTAVKTGEETLTDLPLDPRNSDSTQGIMDELALLCYDFGNTLIYRARAAVDNEESIRNAKAAYAEARLRFDKSIELYGKLIESFPEDIDYLENCNWYVSESLKGKGVTYTEENDLEKALALFKEAIQVAPENCDAMLRAGYIYELQGNLIYARESYRRAYESAPTEASKVEAFQRLETLRN